METSALTVPERPLHDEQTSRELGRSTTAYESIAALVVQRCGRSKLCQSLSEAWQWTDLRRLKSVT